MQPIAAPLLQWFDANKRLLPFRQEPSAYHIWVSEIMLQQTRVSLYRGFAGPRRAGGL